MMRKITEERFCEAEICEILLEIVIHLSSERFCLHRNFHHELLTQSITRNKTMMVKVRNKPLSHLMENVISLLFILYHIYIFGNKAELLVY